MWKIASDHAKRWWSCSRKALLAEAMVDKVMERALQVFARGTCHVENITSQSGGALRRAVGYGRADGGESSEEGKANGGQMQPSRVGTQTQHSIGYALDTIEHASGP